MAPQREEDIAHLFRRAAFGASDADVARFARLGVLSFPSAAAYLLDYTAQPDDVEGWARLGRSYMVLNEPQKARDAYAHAVKLKPDDAALKEAFEAAQSAAAKSESGAQ